MTSISNEELRKEIEQLVSKFPLDQRCDVLMLVDHINHYQLVQLKEMVTAISPKIQQRSRYNDPLVFEPLTRFIKDLGQKATEKQKAALRHNKRFKHNVKKA